MPNQEPAFARPFGNGLMRVITLGLSRPCLKTLSRLLCRPDWLPLGLQGLRDINVLKDVAQAKFCHMNLFRNRCPGPAAFNFPLWLKISDTEPNTSSVSRKPQYRMIKTVRKKTTVIVNISLYSFSNDTETFLASAALLSRINCTGTGGGEKVGIFLVS